jgi:phosphatidylglycerophosphatase GEP4
MQKCQIPYDAHRMVQYWNAKAVAALPRLLAAPSLLLPHAEAKTVGHIDVAMLYSIGVRAVAMDKDNTITAPYAPTIHPTAAVSSLCLSVIV